MSLSWWNKEIWIGGYKTKLINKETFEWEKSSKIIKRIEKYNDYSKIEYKYG